MEGKLLLGLSLKQLTTTGLLHLLITITSADPPLFDLNMYIILSYLLIKYTIFVIELEAAIKVRWTNRNHTVENNLTLF